MFDEVPVRVWLLIVIAVAAFAPAQYVYRHVAHSPSRRDITQPTEDLSWRTTERFSLSLLMLVALLGLAIFIFTPTAEHVAASPRFWPVLMLVFGVFAAFTVVQGFATRRIEPLVRGFSGTYERSIHPKRYWASMAWNAAMGCLVIWLAYQANEDASTQAIADKCVSAIDVHLLEQQLAACTKFIEARPDDPAGYMDRGLLYLDIGALDQAAADFTRAHGLDPEDPGPLAYRGAASAWKNDRVSAEKDFLAVRSMDPSNPVMLRGEAILKKEAGDLEGAVDRLTASLAREPDNLWALRTRAELYWELGEHEKSAADDRRWLQLKKQVEGSGE
ncbi:MAG TPA: tetratricopeptide repeat protein [Allosphingosinicella sp.]|uniref:tetratricopeptide repeat protein n=1 Tax=Allosphingosinicella sp. TaxID=2823234 RepID=UPI002ED8F3A9